MWLQFFLQNAHFAINVFGGLVFGAIGWLYWDALTSKKNFKSWVGIFGFFFLGISYLLTAMSIESSVLESQIVVSRLLPISIFTARISGYISILFFLNSTKMEKHPGVILPLNLKSLAYPLIYPILSVATGFSYLRRATVGLENHLRAMAYGFYVLALSDLTYLITHVFADTQNVGLFKLVAPFGPLWTLARLLSFISFLILFRWVYFYLVKRIFSQLLFVLTASILVIFLISTVSFSGFLVKNVETETLSRLKTDVAVLAYNVDSKKAELLADAKLMASDGEIIAGISSEQKGILSSSLEETLIAKNLSSIVIVDDSGKIVFRAEDQDNVGESLSNDPQVKRALNGEGVSGMVTRLGVLAPKVLVSGAAPIYATSEDEEEPLIGAIVLQYGIDDAFVDGIKKATGLEAGIYADDTLSATTFLAPDGESRLTGIKETGIEAPYTGSVNLANTLYYGSFLPLTDVDENPLGMFFVGTPQTGVIRTAGRSIELTFIVTAILMVISILPTLLISRHIASQIK